MTFDEFIQDGLGTANKLFAKLAQTGPNAVKTRERLFLDLKAELNHLSRFERNHLIPALGDQKKTRALVKALEQDGEKVAAYLADLETAPRAGDAFLQKLTELQGVFQAHVRDERQALLPAVLEALHRVQQAEQAAADQEAADLAAAQQEAADLKAAQAQAQAQAEAAAEAAAHEAPAPVVAAAVVEPHVAVETPSLLAPDVADFAPATPPAPEPVQMAEPVQMVEPVAPVEPPHDPFATPAPLAAIALLHAVPPPATPIALQFPKSIDLPPSTSMATPLYGIHAWANLMQEAAAGAMIGYRLLLACSHNPGFAALQTRLMKEQIELMTKGGYKMIEAAQRLTKTAGRL